MVPRSDADVLELCHANYLEFGRECARASGPEGTLHEDGGVLLYRTATPFPVWANAAHRVDPAVDPADVLDRAEAFFGVDGRGFSVSVRRGNVWHGIENDLADEAKAHGLLAITEAPAMVCRQPVEERPAPDGIELRWVTDREAANEMIRLNDAAYQSLGMPEGVIVAMACRPEAMLAPHLATVLAVRDGRALSTAQVLWSHGVAGVYFVGTVEEGRGLGLADLVTRAVTNLAFERGAPFVTLQASPMGEAIYRRMGYEELYRYHTFTLFR